ncbi:MAG: SpoIID/LytB domain-containing protein, partial [Oscillospiraceae bacterium]
GSAQYYYFSNGELPAAGWTTEVESARRYVLADGQMAQGWQTIEGARYYFAANGAPLTNWQTIASRWYNFSAAGVQQTGWQEKIVTGGTVRFYYNADGSLPAAGWNDNLDGARRYVLADGQMAQGWQTIAGYKYYFEIDGTAKTGSHTIDGTVCIFDASGRYVAPPSILAVNYDTAWSATKAVTVTGSANSLLADQTLQYSFDGGVTWQAENSKSFAAGTVLAAGTIRIRDSIGNIVLYNTQITLANTGGTSFGIDVSAHQGLINWAAVKASGVEFAIIRSLSWNKTTNYYGIDPYFEYNVRNAKANGIKVGTYLYSYAFSREEMQEEITYFINSTEVQNLLREGILFDMPVFIDYEDPLIVNNTTNLTIDQRTDIVRYGMQLLEQMSNYKMLPGFYTYYNFAKNVINGAALQAEGFEFWLARFNTSAHGWSPAPPIWQYSSTGTVSGISGNVDLNYSYKDYSFINGGTVPPASSSYNLTVTNQSGQVVTASAATILAQIVQAEVGGFGNAEVFKAQAVAAQSWILYQQSQGYSAPQVALSSPTAAVQTAVNAVVNQTLTYNGTGAFTPYYAYSNGTTNNSQYWGSNLPYLTSVSSSGDSEKAAYTGQISYGDLKARIEAVYGSGTTDGYAPADWIKITGRNAAGYVTSVSVCGRTPTVDYFYQTLIRYNDGNGKLVYPIGSPSFEISFNGSNMWTFTTRGYGHGVGMSQYGAYKMALSGSTYSQILAHYYPGAQITTVG